MEEIILIGVGLVLGILVMIGIVKFIGWLMNYSGTDFSRPTSIERRYQEIKIDEETERKYQEQRDEAQERSVNDRNSNVYHEQYWCHHIKRNGRYCNNQARPDINHESSIGEYGPSWTVIQWGDIPVNMFKCIGCNQWFCFEHMAYDNVGTEPRYMASFSGTHSGYCFACAVTRKERGLDY